MGTDTLNLDLTAAEQAEVDLANQPPAAAAPVVETQPPAPAAVVAAEPDASAKALADAASEMRAAAEAMRSAQQPPAAAPAAAPEPAKEPNWDAEKAALRAKYDAGEIDDDLYEKQREELLDRKSDWKADQRVAQRLRERDEQDAQTAEAAVKRDWNSAVERFKTADTNNLTTDPARKAVFEVMLSTAAEANPNAGYDAWLKDAGDRTLKAFGITPQTAQDQAKAIAEATRKREDQRGAPPIDLSRAPNAGNPAVGSAMSNLDSLDIDTLENTLARMSEDKINEYLADAPGGLRDMPRGV